MADSDDKDSSAKEEKLSSDPKPAKATESDMAKSKVPDGNDVFPISCKRFVATLVHTHNEVWTKLLLARHGRENHTHEEWHALISDHSTEPAHPSL